MNHVSLEKWVKNALFSFKNTNAKNHKFFVVLKLIHSNEF